MDFYTTFYITISFLQLIFSIYILTQPQENWALIACAYCMLSGIILQLLIPITQRQRYFRDILFRNVNHYLLAF